MQSDERICLETVLSFPTTANVANLVPETAGFIEHTCP